MRFIHDDRNSCFLLPQQPGHVFPRFARRWPRGEPDRAHLSVMMMVATVPPVPVVLCVVLVLEGCGGAFGAHRDA